MTPSVLASSIASPHRRTLLPDRQPCKPTLGMADVHGFHRYARGVPPVVFSGSMNSEEVRVNKDAMNVDTAETIGGVVRLLRRAAVLAWTAADRVGAGSPRQLFALGVDLAADEARHLVPVGTDLDGPKPVGETRPGC
jgi:hypothetical protein